MTPPNPYNALQPRRCVELVRKQQQQWRLGNANGSVQDGAKTEAELEA